MEGPADMDVLPMYDEEPPDSLYAKLTANGLQEVEAQGQAEEDRCKTNAPPPDMRTPQQKADHLRDDAAGVFLYGVYGGAGKLSGTPYDIPTFRAYVEDFVRSAGAPGDPIERLLLEQLALAHHTVGALHFRAGSSKCVDETCACLGAAARLMAEFRRTTLALQSYRDTSVRNARRTKLKSQRRAAIAAANGHDREATETPTNSEVGSKNRLNGYLNGVCHAEPVLS